MQGREEDIDWKGKQLQTHSQLLCLKGRILHLAREGTIHSSLLLQVGSISQ